MPSSETEPVHPDPQNGRPPIGRRGIAVACAAPFASLYLDQRGLVRACCMNDYHIIGDLAGASLLDIWQGEAARELRQAMVDHDLTKGCEFCKWRVDSGAPELAFSKWFQEFDVDDLDPPWPQQIEFSISNTCNLQCAMCNGEWSSSIRSQREGLPPLPRVYDEAFFDGLRAFLPHLRKAKFLGGEPFLAVETLRVMEAMVELGATTRCHVTTNGTQWSSKVERILDMMPVDVAVSIDAATAETYRQIRIGSDWDTVQRNLDRFQARAEANGTDVTVTFCLMTSNWRELPDFCSWADTRGLGATVNTVTEPAHLSLYHEDVDQLTAILRYYEERDAEISAHLDRSRGTWQGEIDRIRQQLDDRQAGRVVAAIDSRPSNPLVVRPFARTAQLRRLAELESIRKRVTAVVDRTVGAAAPRLHLDDEATVTAVEPVGPILGVTLDQIIGSHALEAPGCLRRRDRTGRAHRPR